MQKFKWRVMFSSGTVEYPWHDEFVVQAEDIGKAFVEAQERIQNSTAFITEISLED